MQDMPSCPRCGVPSLLIQDYTWHPGGVILQRGNLEHRMVIMDCDNIDPFFRQIEEMVGASIESTVIETKMRVTRDYLNSIISEDVKEKLRSGEMDIAPVVEMVNISGHLMGYGDSRLADLRLQFDDEDFLINQVREPYSVLLIAGDLGGACESVTSRGQGVSYREISSGLFEVKAWPSYEPRRMRAKPEYKPVSPEGGIPLERCPECGGPEALSTYHWHVEKGQIVSEDTNRRVAMLGPASIDTIFRELETEFGEDIPRTIVEAQRRFTRGGIYTVREMGEGDSFRRFLALRGLGDLEEIKLRRNSFEMRLANPGLALILAGILQGYFEDVTGQESGIEWEFGEDGAFQMKVTARG